MIAFIWSSRKGKIAGKKADCRLVVVKGGGYRSGKGGKRRRTAKGHGETCGVTQQLYVVIAVDVMCLYTMTKFITLYMSVNVTIWK